MVKWPLVHPWSGCHHQWRVHHGSSSKILPLWGHDLVCWANHSGWVCALSKGWGLIESLLQSWSDVSGWRQTSIWHQLRDPTWSQCLFWMGGGWGHPPEAFLCLANTWWPGHTAADREASSGGMQGLLWDCLGWSSWGAYGPSPWWMSFIQVCVEFFTTIYNGQEFSLDVGIMGLGVHEGLACKSNGLSILDDAGS